MGRISRYTIDDDFNHQNIKHEIDGGDFAFSSKPQFITIYTSYTFNANGVKTGVLHIDFNRWNIKR